MLFIARSPPYKMAFIASMILAISAMCCISSCHAQEELHSTSSLTSSGSDDIATRRTNIFALAGYRGGGSKSRSKSKSTTSTSKSKRKKKRKKYKKKRKKRRKKKNKKRHRTDYGSLQDFVIIYEWDMDIFCSDFDGSIGLQEEERANLEDGLINYLNKNEAYEVCKDDLDAKNGVRDYFYNSFAVELWLDADVCKDLQWPNIDNRRLDAAKERQLQNRKKSRGRGRAKGKCIRCRKKRKKRGLQEEVIFLDLKYSDIAGASNEKRASDRKLRGGSGSGGGSCPNSADLAKEFRKTNYVYFEFVDESDILEEEPIECLPSIVPTSRPMTRMPSLNPSASPTPAPTQATPAWPSANPSASPTPAPTQSQAPTTWSSANPSASPSPPSTPEQSLSPSQDPTGDSSPPSVSSEPSLSPSLSNVPSLGPSPAPSSGPSPQPSGGPFFHPSANPSADPTVLSSASPSLEPSSKPTISSKLSEEYIPSADPSTSQMPSSGLSLNPSLSPSAGPSNMS